DIDLGGELAGQLHEFRRGTSVQPQGVHDLDLPLDYRHRIPSSSAANPAMIPYRKPPRRGVSQSESITPMAVTPSKAPCSRGDTPVLSQLATSGTAKPTDSAA